MNFILKNLIIHLRFHFGVVLLPVFLFALSDLEVINFPNTIIGFFILHFLVYPSSNGYNSLMDNDTESIGGIKNPPKVPSQMLYLSIMMDGIALILSFIYFDYKVLISLLLYIIFSRLYSYRKIRLKKYAIISFLIVGIFQGIIIYLTTIWMNNPQAKINQNMILPLIIAFLLVSAGYPISQIYQHKQDLKDGITTISMKLGIKGTFLFSGLLFGLQTVLMFIYQFYFNDHIFHAILFIICSLPVVVFFTTWMRKSLHDKKKVNYSNTMKMNSLGAILLNTYFILILIF